MRKISLLVAFLLLCTVFQANPVHADSLNLSYLPLLTGELNPSIPREIQSIRAYDSILPGLIRLKEAGKIVDFEPDFYGGFVRVTLPITSSQVIEGLSLYPSLNEIMVKPLEREQSFLKAPPGIYISVNPYSSCFYVYGAATGTNIIGKLKTATSELVGAAEGLSDTSLYYWDCFDGPSPVVLPGYSLEFTIEIAGGDPMTYTTTVPQNTFNTITKSTASITGSATPNLPYALDWYHAILDAGNNYQMLREEGTIPATGSWSETYSSKFRGGDYLVLILETNTVFHSNFSMHVPNFSCTLRSPDCIYHGFPRKAVTITVKHIGITYTFSGMTNRQGDFAISLEDATGTPLQLKAGDVITATGAVTETLPTLTAVVNRTTDRITGKAPVNNYFEVNFAPFGVAPPTKTWLKTDALGNYNADFTAAGIPASGLLKVEVYYCPKNTGNVTRLQKMVP